MASNGEQARQVRAREAGGASSVRSAPVRSASVRSNAGTAASKRTKVSVKRAANDDSQRMAITVPVQQSKKRAALTNLTNQSNTSAGFRNNTGISKSQGAAGKGKAHVVTESKHETPPVDVSVPLIQNKAGASNVQSNPPAATVVQNDENLLPETTTLSIQAPKAESVDVIVKDVGAEAIAALEQETKLNLYISKEPKGDSVDSNQPCKIACSNQKYMDIDSNHKDPQTCSSYASDIYHYLRISELKRRPSKDFMDVVQHDINASMRGILVDWLVEVAEEYKLVPDTLYLTVTYIDRFLSSRMVNRQRLQLLGVACMLIAAKYEEICAPQVEEFCYITDNTYCKDEVLEMERHVLNQLHFELTGPTTKTFLRRFLRAAQACQKNLTLHMEFLGNYLAELTLVEYDFLKYLPSMIAGSAVFVARFTLDPHVRPWNSTLQHYTGYRSSELKDCVQAIHNLQHNTSNCTLPAIREKYSQHKFKCVATIPSPVVIPAEYFEDHYD